MCENVWIVLVSTTTEVKSKTQSEDKVKVVVEVKGRVEESEGKNTRQKPTNELVPFPTRLGLLK